MGFVHCYLIEDEGRRVLVDPGWDTDDGVRVLRERLRGLGVVLADLDAVHVTHLHPDHLGTARVIQAEAGCPVYLGEADARGIRQAGDGTTDRRLASITGFLTLSGAPVEVVDALETERGLMGAFDRFGALRLESTPPEWCVGDIRVETVSTPGHTPGHSCYYLPAQGLLLTGDHVLPRVTPNVAAYDYAANPLADYLASLRRLQELDVRQVLPGHEFRFDDLGRRVAQLLDHHERRADEVITCLTRLGSATTWDLAERLRWSRPWADMDGYARRSANGETAAHLTYLLSESRVCAAEGDVIRWSRHAS